MNYLLSFLITYTEDLILYLIAANYSGKFVLTVKQYIKMFLEITFLCFIIYVCFPDMHPAIIVILGQVITICVCFPFETGMTNKITLFITSMLTMFVCEIPAPIVLAVLFNTNTITNHFALSFIGHCMTILIVFFIFKTPVKQLFNRTLKTSFAYKTALIYFYIFLISTLIPARSNPQFIYKNAQLGVICSLLMLISVGTLFYYEKVITTKNSDITYYQKNMPIYEDLIHGIRTNQHEFANRMQSLNVLLTESEDLNTIRENLLKYTSEYALPIHSYAFLKLNMPLLAASLYSQSNKALSQGKQLNFTIHTYELHTCVSEVLLSDLSNILIQNALEESKTGAQIYVTIDSNDTQTMIEVRNPVDRLYTNDELSNFFKSGYTTKKKEDFSHGYGLYFLSKTIHKKKGQLLINCAEFEGEYWISIKMKI